MKKLLVFALVLCLSGSAWATVSVNGKAPILEWSFEGNYNDTSGNGYHATAGGISGYSSDTLPNAGVSSGEFDGIDDAISRSGGMSLLPTNAYDPYTINVLVKNGDYAGGYHGEFGFGPPNTLYQTTTIAADVGGANRAYWMCSSGSGQIGYTSPGDWYMLTAVATYQDGGYDSVCRMTLTLYINGGYSNTDVSNTHHTQTSQYAAAGELKQANYASDWFTGLADEFTIWDEALSATDVAGLWDYYNIPEPATICLLGLGGLALLRKRR
jgi:hypothetical protein